MGDAVTQAKVARIVPEKDTDGQVVSFLVTMVYNNDEVDCENKISVIRARKVAICIGMMNIPRMPDWLPSNRDAVPENHLLHSKELLDAFEKGISCKLPCSIVAKERADSRLLVVGGGLTSAHLALLGARSGFFSKVFFCLIY